VPTITALRLSLLREEGKSPLFARPRADAGARAKQLSESQVVGNHEVVFLAEWRETIIGMLRCVIGRGSPLIIGTRYCLLTSAYVRPAARRRGVLAALVRSAEDWCRSQGLCEMRLHCTVENVGGHAAWAALGFVAAEVLLRREIPPRKTSDSAKPRMSD
jgi:GNAT superfamily N-acetyltransferase